jgi:ribose 5-phosphate isomerase A
MSQFTAEEKEAMKAEAGIAACAFVESGMQIGIGTGSTVKYTILELGRRIREEGLEISGIPTSDATETMSIEQGIPMLDWRDCDHLDLVIDGADEFDPELHLIKGGGGALLREKIVAESSGGMIVVADASKRVDVLGAFALPIEVNPYGWEQTKRRIESLCSGTVELRGPDYRTDNGNPILDANFGPNISDPVQMEADLRAIAGVVEVGLFTNTADVVVLAAPGGCELIRKPTARL